MNGDSSDPAKPRVVLPMALCTAGLLAVLGLAWFAGAVAVPAWRARKRPDSHGDMRIEARWHLALRADADIEELLKPGITQPRLTHSKPVAEELLVTTPEEWRRIWSAARKPMPSVDFEKHMVLGSYRLLSGDGALDVYIDRIDKREGGCVVYVKVQTVPPACCGTCNVLGEAVDYVLVKRTDLPFVAVEDPYWFAGP